jgi:hypothetical protein
MPSTLQQEGEPAAEKKHAYDSREGDLWQSGLDSPTEIKRDRSNWQRQYEGVKGGTPDEPHPRGRHEADSAVDEEVRGECCWKGRLLECSQVEVDDLERCAGPEKRAQESRRSAQGS